MLMRSARALILAGCMLGLGVGQVLANEDEGGCAYNRAIYPDQSEMCQSGHLMRCDNGAWGEIGDCEKEPMPEPVSSGGDRVQPAEE